LLGAALDEKRRKEFDQAFRRAARGVDFRGIKTGRLLLLAGGLALVVLFFSVVLSPARLVETVEGRPASTFVVPTKYFRESLRIQVTLEDGRSVSITLPRNTQMKYAPMKIEILERRLGPIGHTQYRFAGYADEPG
jgi:hypothetical protein